ncbi:MAG: hypothetical protein GX863_09475 [Firmicutes bacterium]|nr:hypothetical protein [Candidatus Fermentithermobacillaceae bacterium]
MSKTFLTPEQAAQMLNLSGYTSHPSPGSTGIYGAADAGDERSRAIRTLLDIRARTRKGSVPAILRGSRRELLDRGHMGSDDK